MSKEPPLWRKVFDAVEEQVGPRLQDGVQHDRFADAVTIAKRVQRGAGRRVEGATTTVLHLLNIPARRDLRRASAQLTRIERDLRALSQEIQEQRSRKAQDEDA